MTSPHSYPQQKLLNRNDSRTMTAVARKRLDEWQRLQDFIAQTNRGDRND